MSDSLPVQIRGVLFDLDGTLFLGDEAYEGAIETVRRLLERGLKIGFLSNITRMSRRAILEKLNKMGFAVEDSELVTPTLVAARQLRSKENARVMLLTGPEVHEDFAGITQDSKDPHWIVVGDMGDGFLPAVLDQAFLALMRGAELLALQKNRYWRTPQGFRVDAGAYVAALEYASGKKAQVVGKPEPAFFQTALSVLNLPPEQVAMCGDDLTNDIAGAKSLGMFGILVRTGKFHEGDLRKAKIQPDLVLDSVVNLLLLP